MSDQLDHDCRIGAMTKGKEVFSYLHLGADGINDATGDDDARDELRGGDLRGPKSVTRVTPTVTYRACHGRYMALDGGGRILVPTLLLPERPRFRGVKVDLPMAKEYSHIHFGVWAGS